MSDDLLRTTLSRAAILLTGSVACVTGGGGGIGRGIALGLAEFGADVAILDRDGEAAERVAELIREKGRQALAITVDVTDREGVQDAVRLTVDRLGGLHTLVNNVGGTRPIKLLDMSDRQIDRHIDLNLRSLVTVTQAGAKAMVSGGARGSIINVTSIEGLRAAPTFSVYAACKAGMVNFTRTAALELAEHGIRVNAIAPDFVPTEWMARHSPDVVSLEARAAHDRYVPLGRPGNLDDCAGAAVFLASSMASYITGVTLNVDGGTWASSGWTRDGADGWRLFN